METYSAGTWLSFDCFRGRPRPRFGDCGGSVPLKNEFSDLRMSKLLEKFEFETSSENGNWRWLIGGNPNSLN